MFENINIRTKILLGLSLVILLGLAAALVNISGLQEINNSLAKVADGDTPLLTELEKVDEVIRRVTMTTVVIVAVVIFLAIVIVLFLASSISSSINKVRDAAEDIAEGKLDKRIDVTSKDEVGELAAAFNRMADSLLQARRLPDNILRSMKDSLFVVDRKGNVVEANKAAVEALGFKKEELVGRPIKAIFKTAPREKR